MPKQWTKPAPAPDALLFDLLDVPPFIVQTLYNRGLRTAEAMQRFLSPDFSTRAGDPFTLKDMDVAVARVQAAITRGEKIAVYADFDVDGVCSAVLLMQVLQSMNAHTQVYIPRRVEEGYGLNKPAIGRLAESGVRLLITADCGAGSFAEIAHANSLGVDVIVTDHHHVHNDIPAALAVLNPHRPDCAYPFKELSGVGVAYKLAEALLRMSSVELAAASFLDLVALGTVVDVAPLIGENRSLVQQGLALMRTSPRPGLRALMEQARVKPESVDTGHLGFSLGPRLNAAGRLDSAQTSYDLLLSTSVEQATPLAKTLEELNQKRQQLLEAALTTARLEAAGQIKQSPLIFVASAAYLAGIVGLVAGRLAEEYYRPTIAVERGETLSRGSCRSIPDFHIARALDECDDLLERHGGHAQAAGFIVQTERLAELQERLAGIAARELGERSLEPIVNIDCVIPLTQASWPTLRWLQLMRPFGAGNPNPVLQSDDVRVKSIRLAGANHLQLSVTDGQATWGAVAFRQGDRLQSVKVGDHIDVAYSLEENEWNGEKKLQLVIKDLRASQGQA